MKLWVDDIRNAPDETWSVARTVTSAIRALAMFSPEEISLDHDISHQVAVGELSRLYPCAETFQAVAHYIAEKYILKAQLAIYESNEAWNPKVTIHTSNPVGAKELEAILVVAGIDPVIRLTGLANRLEMEI